MKALLSIKPQFVEKIFNGEKKFEYRKTVFAQKNIKIVVVYATMPVGKIVGEFSIEEILEHTPTELWAKTKEYSGIAKEFFDEYFDGRSKAFAIKIKETTLYDIPINPYESEERFTPPQSFSYISNNPSVLGYFVDDTEEITTESKKRKKKIKNAKNIEGGISKPRKIKQDLDQ
jgi:predicted transcriptional regulator